jgi:hypothetical protein
VPWKVTLVSSDSLNTTAEYKVETMLEEDNNDGNITRTATHVNGTSDA